jgi:hypothetical protein
MSGDGHCVNGTCVSCAADADCSSAAPICDTGVCRGCAADAECASAACDTDSGACLDEANVAYASASGSATSMCSQTDPCTLHRAFSIIDASRPNIKLAPGTYSTYETFTGTYALTVYGPATLNGVAISSNGGALRLRDLTSTFGAFCSAFSSVSAPPTLDIERVTFNVDGGNGGGMGGSQCNVNLNDVTVNTSGPGNAAGFDGIGGAGTSTVIANKLHMVGGDPAIFLSNQSTMTITNAIF